MLLPPMPPPLPPPLLVPPLLPPPLLVPPLLPPLPLLPLQGGGGGFAGDPLAGFQGMYGQRVQVDPQVCCKPRVSSVAVLVPY
jgi:hypothetical protein